VKGLDEALPEKRFRKRGRGAEGDAESGKTEKDVAGMGAKRQRNDAKAAGSGEKKENASTPTGPAAKKTNGAAKPAEKKNSNGADKATAKPKTNGTAAAAAPAAKTANWMSEADRAAAEKRKAKWATPAAPTPAPAASAAT